MTKEPVPDPHLIMVDVNLDDSLAQMLTLHRAAKGDDRGATTGQQKISSYELSWLQQFLPHGQVHGHRTPRNVGAKGAEGEPGSQPCRCHDCGHTELIHHLGRDCGCAAPGCECLSFRWPGWHSIAEGNAQFDARATAAAKVHDLIVDPPAPSPTLRRAVKKHLGDLRQPRRRDYNKWDGPGSMVLFLVIVGCLTAWVVHELFLQVTR